MTRAWTEADAITYLRELSEKRGDGQAPTLAEIMPHHMVMVRLFGSIANAQKAAGFEPRKQGRPRKTP